MWRSNINKEIPPVCHSRTGDLQTKGRKKLQQVVSPLESFPQSTRGPWQRPVLSNVSRAGNKNKTCAFELGGAHASNFGAPFLSTSVGFAKNFPASLTKSEGLLKSFLGPGRSKWDLWIGLPLGFTSTPWAFPGVGGFGVALHSLELPLQSLCVLFGFDSS